MIFRTQLFNAADMPNVVKVQAGYKVQPLSKYLKQPAPAAVPAVQYLKADAEIAKKEFWQVLDFALQYIPASPEEAAIRAKLASIGIGSGKKFDMKDLRRTVTTRSTSTSQAGAQSSMEGMSDRSLATAPSTTEIG